MEVFNPAGEAAGAPPATLEPSYTPSAVLHLFNNSLAVPQTRRLIQVRGIYHPGRGTAYGGFYYDTLRDEASDASMTLVVPGALRGRLQAGSLVRFQGFIARKVVATGGRIELHIHLDSLLEQPAPRFSEEDLRALEIQQKKAALGYRDVEALLRARLAAGEAARVVILIGKTAIIDADITHQLGAAAAAYDVHFHRVNLHAETAILAALSEYDDEDTDLLVISRGGGEGVEIFNSCALAEACIGLTPHFLTAIGHKEDVTLLQRVADKAFITPTALGQFFSTLYNEVAESLNDSKAALIQSVTRQLAAQYEGQLRNLTEKLTGAEAIHAERAALLGQQLQDREAALRDQRDLVATLQARMSEARTAVRPLWVYVLVAALAGVVVGALIGIVAAG